MHRLLIRGSGNNRINRTNDFMSRTNSETATSETNKMAMNLSVSLEIAFQKALALIRGSYSIN